MAETPAFNQPLFGGDELVEVLIGHAETHGSDDDPDHEVGDLQDMLRVAWGLMTPEQRRKMICHNDVSNVVEAATGDPLATSMEEVYEDEWEDACEFYGIDTSFQYTDEQQLEIVNHYRLRPVGEAQEEGVPNDSARGK